ncbi:MAG: hypothetical protein WB341_00710 [Terracidiphilus sp.]
MIPSMPSKSSAELQAARLLIDIQTPEEARIAINKALALLSTLPNAAELYDENELASEIASGSDDEIDNLVRELKVSLFDNLGKDTPPELVLFRHSPSAYEGPAGGTPVSHIGFYGRFSLAMNWGWPDESDFQRGKAAIVLRDVRGDWNRFVKQGRIFVKIAGVPAAIPQTYDHIAMRLFLRGVLGGECWASLYFDAPHIRGTIGNPHCHFLNFLLYCKKLVVYNSVKNLQSGIEIPFDDDAERTNLARCIN